MLTKEAKTVLCQLYKEYLVRRDGNVSRSRAKCFSSAESIHASLFPDWSLEDVEDVLRELGRNGFLDIVTPTIQSTIVPFPMSPS